MAFISVFDVIGPNMIGPSSSHTAGADSLAFLAQKMINGPLKKVDFTLYGSFAKTYRGHGTDRALLGGIMGFTTDDKRIPDSFSIAEEKGLAVQSSVREGGGNNGAIINTSLDGIPVIVVGVPVRYIHSHYGITSYYDFEATVQLATEVVRSMTEEIIRSF